jgi:tripartite-type tricarboxylate transporter receptor subunit TctC
LLLPQIQAGKLRALAVASQKRWLELPDVPTLAEAGFAGFPPDIWYGLIAPTGTPAPVVAKLNGAVNARLQSPELQASLARLGLDPRPMTPQQFGDVLVSEVRQWGELARQTGIKLE